jgi:hypothetical protein
VIQAYFIRGSGRLLAACIAFLLGLVAGAVVTYRHSRSSGAVQEGHDLTVYGPQSSGVIGFNQVHVGTTYRFAFPVPRNTSTRPVKLTGAAIDITPPGVQVVGYPIYSLKEVGNYLLNYDDSVTETRTPLLDKKDYAASGVTIAPRSDSDYFVMVAVKVVGPVTKVLSGCTFLYTVGSHKYRQSFPCQFQLGDEAG